jgi:hypothetical protein
MDILEEACGVRQAHGRVDGLTKKGKQGREQTLSESWWKIVL